MADDFKSFYKKGDRKINTWCRWNDRLDPYGRGCSHDCCYCYAKSLLDFRGLWNPDSPTPARPMDIRRKIHSIKPGKVLRIGQMTDPFQPCEREQRVTYSMLKQLNARPSLRWIWNNLSTGTSQIIDTCIYALISFGIGLGMLWQPGGIKTLFGLVAGQYLLKLCLALIDTPFFYLFTRGADKINPVIHDAK